MVPVVEEITCISTRLEEIPTEIDEYQKGVCNCAEKRCENLVARRYFPSMRIAEIMQAGQQVSRVNNITYNY